MNRIDRMYRIRKEREAMEDSRTELITLARQESQSAASFSQPKTHPVDPVNPVDPVLSFLPR